MKKKFAKLLALMLAMSMVVPNGTGMNKMTVQAEETLAVSNEMFTKYTEIPANILKENARDNCHADCAEWNDGPFSSVFDDNDNLNWHSYYTNGTHVNPLQKPASDPYIWLQTGFGESKRIGKITYAATSKAPGDAIKGYEIQYVNLPGVTLKEDGNLPDDISEEDGWKNVTVNGEILDTEFVRTDEEQSVEFDVIEATHIRIIAKTSHGNNYNAAKVRVWEVTEISEVRAELGDKIEEIEATGNILTTEAATALADAKVAYENYDESITDEVLQGYLNALSGEIYAEYKIDKETLKDNAAASTEQIPQLGTAGDATYAFNDNVDDWWNVQYSTTDGTNNTNIGLITPTQRQWLETGFDERVWVSRITWVLRSDQWGTGSRIRACKIWAADLEDPTGTPGSFESYTELPKDSYVELKTNDDCVVGVVLKEPVKATHIRIEATELVNTSSAHLSIVECDVYKKEVTECNVTLGSVVNGTKTESIANLIGGGVYAEGGTVTVTAPAKVGYNFVGWFTKGVTGATYAVENALSTANTYTFNVAANTDLVAVYAPDAEGKVELTITDTAKVTVTDANEQTLDISTGVKAGTKVKVAYADAANFLYWKNASGKIVSTKATYEFTVVNNTTLTPVAKSVEENKVLVEYLNEYDQVLSTALWTEAGTLSAEKPSKLGYTCEGWAFELNATEAVTEEAVWGKVADGYVKLYPVYAKAETKCKVAYNNGSVSDEVQVAIGETYTVTAGTVENKVFNCWKVGEKAVSYNPSYTFLVTGDVTVTAVFENSAVEKASILDITTQYEIKNAEDKVEKVAFVASREIAEGYTVLEHGMLYARNSEITDAAAFVEGVAGVNKFTASGTGMKGALTLNVKLNGATSIKVRAYAIVKDAKGVVTTLYSDMATYTAQQ